MRLDEVATIERAKKGKDYPAGVTLVQLSASRGQVVKHPGGEAKSMYAVIEAKPDGPMTPAFLYWYMSNSMPAYVDRMLTGLNIQADALASYPVHLPIPPRPKDTN